MVECQSEVTVTKSRYICDNEDLNDRDGDAISPQQASMRKDSK